MLPNFSSAKPLPLNFGLAFNIDGGGTELVNHRTSSLVAYSLEIYSRSQADRPWRLVASWLTEPQVPSPGIPYPLLNI